MNQRTSEVLSMLGVPGNKLFSSLGGEIRALHVMDRGLYAVAGGNVYAVDASGRQTILGTVNGSNLMSSVDDGLNLVVCDGDSWIVTASSVTKIVDPDYKQSNSVTWQDGYFIWNVTGTGQFIWSEIGDPGDIDPLSFASAESAPDDTVAVLSDHRELTLCGLRTFEFWRNVGGDTIWERLPGAVIERGIRADKTLRQVDNTFFWLGDDGIVYRLDERIPRRISTHAIEQTRWTDQAFGWTYTQKGHVFYALTVPGVVTWVFDVASGEWHQRQTFGKEDSNITHVVEVYGKVIAGASNGDLYELDPDTLTDNGGEIERRRTTVPVFFEGREFIIHEVELECETGAQEDPEIWLEISEDRGHTWQGPYLNSLGAQGEYNRRVYWPLGGDYRSAVFRINQTDATKTAWIRLRADIEVL